jgi:hypothetical protein
MFPEVDGYTYGSVNPNINVHSTNKHTMGWRLDNTTRLIWTNGEFDPWRTSGMSSQFRPGGQLASTPELSRPGQAVEVECGVFWYVCNECWCPKGGEEAIYISVVARAQHVTRAPAPDHPRRLPLFGSDFEEWGIKCGCAECY